MARGSKAGDIAALFEIVERAAQLAACQTVADVKLEARCVGRGRFNRDDGIERVTRQYGSSRVELAGQVLGRLEYSAADNFLEAVSQRDADERVGQ